MGIYIPGMDMPDSCDNCFICNRCEGNCGISDADYLPNKRPDDCPLIELPPHGRLGDLDALALAMMDAKDADQALAMVDDAPTIIPSAKEATP